MAEASATPTARPTTPSAEALALAERALDEVTPPGAVGEVVDAFDATTQVLALRYRSLLEGYPDWLWIVTLAANVEGSPTVLEVSLIPGDSSLVAPEWIPWADRLAEYLAARESDAEEPDAEEQEETDEEFDDFDEADLVGDDDDFDIDPVDDAAEEDAAGEDSVDDTAEDGAAENGTEDDTAEVGSVDDTA